MEKLELNHKKLKVWILSKKLVIEIYKLTEDFPKSELFGTVSQLRRAVVSILCNLSEGSARKSNIERKRFYEISRASLVEVDTLLEISYELSFLKKKEYFGLNNSIIQAFRMLTKLILNT